MADDPAKARFFIIQAVRLGGLALALFGLLSVAGKIALPPLAGYALLVAGVAGSMIAPLILTRRWRSPRP